MTSPNHLYYRAVHGKWTCRFHFAITHPELFHSAPLKPAERALIRAFFWLQKLPGATQIKTSLDYLSQGADQNKVRHTTQITKWGIPLMISTEFFKLQHNGLDVTIEGRQRFFPNYWQYKEYIDSSCRVHASGTGADYCLNWFGLPLQQSTAIEADGLRITMDLGWAQGEQKLKKSTRL